METKAVYTVEKPITKIKPVHKAEVLNDHVRIACGADISSRCTYSPIGVTCKRCLQIIQREKDRDNARFKERNSWEALDQYSDNRR